MVAAAVFLLLNPAWWNAPFELPLIIVEMRAELLRSQVDWIGGYETIGDRIHGFFQYVFAAEHQYFEVAHWAEYEVIRAQIERYESSGLAGLTIGGTSLAGLIGLVMAVAGAMHLARDNAIEAKNRFLLLVWMVGLALITLLLTPLSWARYYLPLAPALAILLSYALVELAAPFWKRHSRRANGIDILD
jgi:4-amino-4-deoxy-L-arabinose transferase-like glycosyltransferase